MGAGPIEDAAAQAVGQNDGSSQQASMTMRIPVDTPDNSAFASAENKPADRPAMSPPEAYIRAQHLFIEAQQLYIHNPDVRTLAAEQEAYLNAQTAYIAYLLTKH
jgi:hypothetical protein